MRKPQQTRQYLLRTARLLMSTALLNALAGLLFAFAQRWLLVALFVGLAIINSALAYVYGRLASKNRLHER